MYVGIHVKGGGVEPITRSEVDSISYVMKGSIKHTGLEMLFKDGHKEYVEDGEIVYIRELD